MKTAELHAGNAGTISATLIVGATPTLRKLGNQPPWLTRQKGS